MTERRYGFRFTLVEAGLLIVSVVLVSVFVFVAGVYVGKGVEAHKTAQLSPPLRMPVKLPEETRAPVTNTPLTWKLPKDKPGETIPSVPSGTVDGSAQTPNPATSTPAASSPATPTKKTTVAAVPPEAPSTLTPNKSQPKTVDPPQALSTKKALPEQDSPQRLSPSEEHMSGTRTVAVPSLTSENRVEKEALSSVQKATQPAKGWKVQVEATSREETAQEIAKALRAQGYEPSVSKVTKQGEVWYRVRVGRFASQEEAVAAIARFRREGKFSQAYPVSE